eukprot:940309-Rhodomonas_salina.4
MKTGEDTRERLQKCARPARESTGETRQTCTAKYTAGFLPLCRILAGRIGPSHDHTRGGPGSTVRRVSTDLLLGLGFEEHVKHHMPATASSVRIAPAGMRLFALDCAEEELTRGGAARPASLLQPSPSHTCPRALAVRGTLQQAPVRARGCYQRESTCSGERAALWVVDGERTKRKKGWIVRVYARDLEVARGKARALCRLAAQRSNFPAKVPPAQR